MKKTIVILSALLALVACNKETPANLNEGPIDASKVVFNFNMNYPSDTKAVKEGWESGDKVFIFFSGLTTGYVSTSYNGSTWTPTFNGSGDLAASGKLTAVYLPYGSSATPSYSTSWTFDTSYDAYYMVAEKVDYTISNTSDVATLSATLDMVNPDDYVQFYIADASAGCTLETDCVIPAGLASIASDGTVAEDDSHSAGDAMTGYAYAGGYQFSGKLTTQIETGDGSGAANGYGYYMILQNNSENRVFFKHSDSELLSSHDAVNLPTVASGRWLEFGSGEYVTIGSLAWATVNAGAAAPWECGGYYTWADRANDIQSGEHVPSQTELEALYTPTKYWTSVKGMNGYVIVDGNNFIFLPAAGYRNGGSPYFVGDYGNCWSGTEFNTDFAYFLDFSGSSFDVYIYDKDFEFSVRPVQNL